MDALCTHSYTESMFPGPHSGQINRVPCTHTNIYTHTDTQIHTHIFILIFVFIISH